MTDAEKRRKKIDALRPEVKKMLGKTYPNDNGDNYPRGMNDPDYISKQDISEVTYAIASFLVDFDIEFTQTNVKIIEKEIHEQYGKAIRADIKKCVKILFGK